MSLEWKTTKLHLGGNQNGGELLPRYIQIWKGLKGHTKDLSCILSVKGENSVCNLKVRSDRFNGQSRHYVLIDLVCVFACVCHSVCVVVRGHISAVSSRLPPRESQGWNSGRQAW